MCKALIAMSGGVDSSVAAYLCKEKGYECMGVVLGTGGFALVWFVIKKKSWADFVAIFKKK